MMKRICFSRLGIRLKLTGAVSGRGGLERKRVDAGLKRSLDVMCRDLD